MPTATDPAQQPGERRTGPEAGAPPDADLAVLRARAQEWARTDLADRHQLLQQLRTAVAEVAGEWVQRSCRAKGISPSTPAAGEEWMGGPYAVLGAAAAYARTLAALGAGRDPLARLRVRELPGDRLGLRVFPAGGSDVLLAGYTGEVWLRPGTTRARAGAGIARRLRDPAAPGRVAVVLGAGNFSAIAVLDVLTKLHQDGAVVLLKLSPVNAHLRPVLERALAPYVERGFVRVTACDDETTARLLHDPAVDLVHLTGSRAAHDAVVFGTGPEAARRRAARTPLLTKPVTSELGGVSPVVLVPGRWSSAVLAAKAQEVATQRLHHSGFDCVATQVVVLPERWPQAEEFVDHLRQALRAAPPRPAYYPGAAERQRAAVAAHSRAELLGGDPQVPRTLLPELDPAADEPAFRTEYFAPVLGVTRLPGADPAQYLANAVRFCNDRLDGDLGANLVADPRTLRGLGGQLTARIAELRYGSVAVNAWVAFAYAVPQAGWGAFPGHDVHDVGSGVGIVHNALLLDPEHVERSVVRGPFRQRPLPLWSVQHRRAHVATEHLTRLAAAPDVRTALAAGLAGAAAALRG